MLAMNFPTISLSVLVYTMSVCNWNVYNATDFLMEEVLLEIEDEIENERRHLAANSDGEFDERTDEEDDDGEDF